MPLPEFADAEDYQRDPHQCEPREFGRWHFLVADAHTNGELLHRRDVLHQAHDRKGYAAGRVPLTVMGLMQYVTPVLQFAVGVGIRHEKVPASELAGFALVWVALIILGISELRQWHASRVRSDELAAPPP